MGERKVLNKYIPADFDPRLVPRSKKPKDDLVPVRMMLPFSIQCSSCSSFMYRGTKFNSKKEPMKGPEGKYLGIQRFRLYIKCTTCSRPISFLTDPKNADYEMENGGTRNYEVWHDKTKTEEEILAEKEQDEKLDPMKALENRVLDSQREMQDLENLDEIKAMNMRHLQMTSVSGITGRIGAALQSNHGPIEVEDLNEHGITASEEEMIKGIKFKRAIKTSNTIKRIEDEDEKELEFQINQSRKRQVAIIEKQQNDLVKNIESNKNNRTLIPHIKVKRKRKLESSPCITKAKEIYNDEGKQNIKTIEKTISSNKDKNVTPDSEDESNNGLGGLLAAYGSSSDSD